MAERTIVKNFNNFRGRDIRSSDLVRSADYAIEFKNARVVQEDSCVNREGGKILGSNAQYEGLATYRWSDTTTGESMEELVSFSEDMYRQKSSTFTVVYAGTDSPVYISIRLDTSTSTFKCTLSALGVDVLSYDLGTGLEAVPVTLSDLKTQIDAIADFSATIAGTTSFPAAFLPITILADLSASPKTQVLTFFEWTKINTLVDDIFSAYHLARGADTWELLSTENMSNCLYIATGYNYLHKYDGQNVYRAGMAAPTVEAGVSFTGTGITDANIRYIYLYSQIDNRGNIITGVEAPRSAAVSPANQSMVVNVRNLLAATGFNTGCAVVNGAQAGVTTITVLNSPHTFKVGDTAYFYDSISASYVERAITATAATTITIAGANVTVANAAVISNNLRIIIYRSTASGLNYYKVAEIPNNSFSATQNYTDSLAIASLGTQYLAPIADHDTLDVFPRYLRSHQDLLIASGAPSTPNTWYYSSGEFPEYFPAESNYVDIRATGGGGIRGIGSDQEHLILGTDRSLFVVTGDIAAGNGRQEKLAQENVGFACHNTIADVGGKIVFLSKHGFYSIAGGYNLIEVGEQISSDFGISGVPDSELPQLRRAFAVHLEDTQEYICFVPCESGSGTSKYANTNSKIHVFNADRESWALWTGLNMGGGMAILDDNLVFQSRRDDSALTVTGNLWYRSIQGAVDDYADHATAIPFELGTQWMDMGEPSVFKVFLWLKAYNLLKQILSARFGLTVVVERDFQRDVPWFDFMLDFGSSSSSSRGWGLFPWGLGAWGSPRNESIKKKLRTGKARSIRYRMTNETLHQKVAISAWETVVTAPYSVELRD